MSSLTLKHPALERILASLADRGVGEVEVGLLIGSGLGGVLDRAEIELEIPYREIDGFPTTQIPGHPGKLVVGRLGAKRCALFVGRFHGYEGASGAVLTLPVQTAAGLGAETMVLTNSVGGLNPTFAAGDMMLIKDHINLMGTNPLVEMIRAYQGNPFEHGQATPFVGLVDAYRTDFYPALRDLLAAKGVNVHLGVLGAVLGPNYETTAEVKMLRVVGADAVCMSTVPEAIYARYAGLAVAALAFITNQAHDGNDGDLPTHEKVLEAARLGAENFSYAVGEMVRML